MKWGLMVMSELEFDVEEWDRLTPAERVQRCLVYCEEAKNLGAGASADIQRACEDLAQHWRALAHEIAATSPERRAPQHLPLGVTH